MNPPAWMVDLDACHADRRWIDTATYFARGGMANLQTKRGCHYKCTFCAYPVIEGKGMRTATTRRRSRPRSARCSTSTASTSSSSSTACSTPRAAGPSACAGRCDRFGRRIRWSCFVAPGNFTAELCDLMLAAGCQSVDFGTDAASPATLRALRKSFNVDDILAASALCRERGLPFCHSLVFGGDGETWDTIADTVAVMDACRPTAVTAMCGVRVYPETPLAATLLARGDVPSAEALHEPFFWFAPAVRDGLDEAIADVARARGNWLLPGRKVNDEEALAAMLRGRGVKGDLWRYTSRRHVGRAVTHP